MNATEKKQVAKFRDELEGYKLKIEDIGGILREMADREQEKYDNLSDGLQNSERGQAIGKAASALDDAATCCESSGEAYDALASLDLD